MKVDNGGVLGR